MPVLYITNSDWILDWDDDVHVCDVYIANTVCGSLVVNMLAY